MDLSDRPAPSLAARCRHIAVRRTARYYTLGDGATGVREVWLACHGYGQLAEYFIRHFEVLAAEDRIVVAPEALSRYYLDPVEQRIGTPGRVGASWMTRVDREREIEDYVHYLDTLYDEAIAPLARDGARLVVLGFSQGVATVVRWIARGRVPFDHLVVWAGTIPPELDLAAFAEVTRGRRLTLVIGTRDPYATAGAFEAHARGLGEHGIDFDFVTFDGDHRLDPGTLADLARA